MPLGSSRAAATAIQPDGKIVVVGRDFAHGGGSAVARYNPNGSPDPSFSGDGKLTKQVGDGAAVALQADGKIVVVGGVCDQPVQLRRVARHELLRRRQADDRDFGGSVGGVAIQADGKIVAVGGRAEGTGDYAFALARYNPNGTLDTASPATARFTDLGDSDRRRSGAPGRRQDRGGGSAGCRRRRLRPGALQLRRLARHELLRRRQAATDFVGFERRGNRRRFRPTARSSGRRDGGQSRPVISPCRDTTPTAGWTRASRRWQAVAPTSDVDQARRRDPERRQDRRGRHDPATTPISGDFALARYNTDGTLDTSFSVDGKQTTDFVGTYFDRRVGWRSRPTARSSRSGSQTSVEATDFALARYNLEWLARHRLLRRRQADDQLRGVRRSCDRGGDPGRRQDRRGRARGPSYAARAPATSARALQPRRLARHELLRRRPPDDRLRHVRRGKRGRDPGRRQDRRGWQCRSLPGRTSRSPATTPTARSTRASPATARRRPTSGRNRPRRPEWRSRTTARSSWSAARLPGLRGRPLQPGRLPRHDLLRRRPAANVRAGFEDAVGVGSSRAANRRGRGRAYPRRQRLRARPLQANGALDTSFSGDGLQTTEFWWKRPGGRVALQGDGKIVAVGQADGDGPRLRPRPLQPERLPRHDLLRRRQADD